MNILQLIQTCRNRRNKAFKDTKAKKRRKKGSNKQINEEDDVDHAINEDNDRNLHIIDNDVISDGASDKLIAFQHLGYLDKVVRGYKASNVEYEECL